MSQVGSRIAEDGHSPTALGPLPLPRPPARPPRPAETIGHYCSDPRGTSRSGLTWTAVLSSGPADSDWPPPAPRRFCRRSHPSRRRLHHRHFRLQWLQIPERRIGKGQACGARAPPSRGLVRRLPAWRRAPPCPRYTRSSAEERGRGTRSGGIRSDGKEGQCKKRRAEEGRECQHLSLCPRSLFLKPPNSSQLAQRTLSGAGEKPTLAGHTGTKWRPPLSHGRCATLIHPLPGYNPPSSRTGSARGPSGDAGV